MNNFSPLFQKAIEELDQWLPRHPDLMPEFDQFFKRIKNLLAEARDSESSQQVEDLVKTILYALGDSGPNEVIREGFLPSFNQVAIAIQKKENRAHS